LSPLRAEANDLLAILVASIRTARGRISPPRRRRVAPSNPKSKIQNPKFSEGGD
jgi:hypothetical protein